MLQDYLVGSTGLRPRDTLPCEPWEGRGRTPLRELVDSQDFSRQTLGVAGDPHTQKPSDAVVSADRLPHWALGVFRPNLVTVLVSFGMLSLQPDLTLPHLTAISVGSRAGPAAGRLFSAS